MFVSEFICLKYSQVLGSLISSLIAYKLANDNWQTCSYLEYLPLQVALKLIHRIINNHQDDQFILTEELIESIDNLNDSEVAIALFPLIIYCYQNVPKLERECDRLNNSLLDKKRDFNDLKIFSIIVYLILDNKIVQQKITKKINEQLELNNLEELKEIQLIETLLINKSPLTRVEEQLTMKIKTSNLGIYQSLYSFLSIPDNLEISLQRSTKFSEQKETSAVLTGLLLGLKHSYSAIPFDWRKTVKTEQIFPEIEQSSQQLVARWQGKSESRINY